MIPLRVQLEGFLSYRDSATLNFDGATLWLLRGANGAGKSSVFDAISYALYGVHRGGMQGAESLIHHACSRLAVEFDFALGDDVFRAHRTLMRGVSGRNAKPSFQVWHLRGPNAPRPGMPAPQAVPETDSARGFSKWVDEWVGLSKETFCASVLLQQGKSDALLEADPAKRHEMLSQIVDLSAYRKLAERADTRARNAKARAETLTRQLAGLLPVDDSEIARLATLESEADALANGAENRLLELAAWRVHSEKWEAWMQERRAIEAALQAANALLSQRELIEQEAARHAELQGVLPQLETLHSEAARAEALRQNAKRDQDFAASRRRDAENAARQGKDAQSLADDLRQKHEAAARRFNEAGAWLLQHTSALHDLDDLRDDRAELSKLDGVLADYPVDLDGQIENAEREVERLGALNIALPRLEEWCAARSDFNAARQAADDDARRAQEIAPLVETADKRVATALSAIDSATQLVNETAQIWTRAETLLLGVQENIARFADVESEASCRYCGQTLTPEHRAAEAARLETEHDNAQNIHDRALEKRDNARQILIDARSERADADATLNDLQKQGREIETSTRDARRDGNAALERAKRAWEQLAPPYRAPLAPDSEARAPEHFTPALLRSARPDQDELKAWRSEVAGEFAERKQFKALTSEATARDKHLTRREPVAQRLSVLEAKYTPEREQELHEARRTAEHERADAGGARDELQAPLEQAETAWRGAEKARQSAADAALEAEARAEKEAAKCGEVERTLGRLRDDLPLQWRELVAPASEIMTPQQLQPQLDGWKTEAQALKAAPARLEALGQALAENERRRGRVSEIGIALEAVPAQARRAVSAIDAERATVESQRRDAVHARDESGDEKRDLQDRRDELARLESEERAAGSAAKLSLHLAELLGRDGLQRHLLQEAEAGIVDNANQVLDRLSGGHLSLELRGLVTEEEATSKTPKALDLVARNAEVVGDDENSALMPVAFLSGSQKFRVAVALALGIGQYASVSARRIESVIIDEGFGSLDKTGRSEMIEELHSLGDTLSRVIVVSHQEDFAETFANRYSIELQGGSSRVALQGREENHSQKSPHEDIKPKGSQQSR